MYITITSKGRYIELTSDDKRFKEKFADANVFQVPAAMLFSTMDLIALRVNNELREECLFEMG